MDKEDYQLVDMPTREGYDLWAEIYDGEDNPLVILESQHIEKLLGDIQGKSIVDLGCGTGRHALLMAAKGAKVTALDFSEGMLAKARKKKGAEHIHFVEHDLSLPLPLESDQFDGVTCYLVLDHIGNLVGLFQEMERLCKVGGFALISVMHPAMNLKGVWARFIDPNTGNRVCPASELNQISDYVGAAAQAGLTIEHISEHVVDEELVARSPRAEKHLGWPILFLMRLLKTARSDSPTRVDSVP